MDFSLRKIIKQTGRDFADYFDVPKNVKRSAKEFRSFSRLIRGKDSSHSSHSSRSSISTSSSARHSVGNTGFHRAYPSIGIRGSYGR